MAILCRPHWLVIILNSSSFSYGPHPDTHRGGGTVCLWGGGVWPFCSIVHLCGEKIVHFRVKAPNLAWK